MGEVVGVIEVEILVVEVVGATEVEVSDTSGEDEGVNCIGFKASANSISQGGSNEIKDFLDFLGFLDFFATESGGADCVSELDTDMLVAV